LTGTSTMAADWEIINGNLFNLHSFPVTGERGYHETKEMKSLHKITLKEFRFLHENFLDDCGEVLLLLEAGDHFIDVDTNTFAGPEGDYLHIDRKLIRKTWKQNGLDTHSWGYWTNDAGKLLLN